MKPVTKQLNPLLDIPLLSYWFYSRIYLNRSNSAKSLKLRDRFFPGKEGENVKTKILDVDRAICDDRCRYLWKLEHLIFLLMNFKIIKLFFY